MNGQLALVLSTLLLSGSLALSVASAWAYGLSQEIAPEREASPAPPIFGVEEPGQKGEKKARLKNPTERGRESSGLTEEDVKKVQEVLKAEGHDPGPIDGKFGPQTRNALRSFRSARGLKDTETIDEETLKQLGVQGGKGPVPRDMPSKPKDN